MCRATEVSRHEKSRFTLDKLPAFSVYQPHLNGDECIMSLQANAGSVNTGNGEFTTNSANSTTRIDARQYVALPNMRNAALWYAKRFGWHIFPLRPGTKQPFKDLGVYQATNDLDQIRAWWKKWTAATIGINCGLSGLLVVDLDSYKDTYQGDSLDLDEETVTGLSGGGGGHLFYAMADGDTFGSSNMVAMSLSHHPATRAAMLTSGKTIIHHSTGRRRRYRQSCAPC